MEEQNIRTWKPHKVQEEFLSLPDSIFEAMYGGAAGGGKSEILLMLPIVRGFYNLPYFKGLLVRRTYPELEKSLILRSHDIYPSTGAVYTSALKRWRFPSGAIIDFGYSEFESDVRKYDTTEYNYIGFDELTSFTEFQYTYLLSRCRTSHKDLPSIVRSATNPGNVGHGWVRKRFVEPARDGRVLIKDPIIKTKRIFIPAKLTDNPHLMSADPDYIHRLALLPEAERIAKLDGDWWTFSGQVFDDWRIQPFNDEPSNACHVIEPFDIPEYYPQILAVDWGFSAMTWAGLGAVSPYGQCILNREYTCTQTKISTWATEVGKMCEGINLVDVVLDPSAWHQRGDEKTIAEQFEEYSGLTPRKADNDRIGGKVLMQEFLRWKQKPKRKNVQEGYNKETADRILRNHGLEGYKEYLSMFQEEPDEEHLPKLLVFNTCKEFIKAIPLCIYSDTNKEDVAEFDGDDPYDGGRYLIKAVHNFIKESSESHKQYQKLSKIIRKFEQTKDYNALHRQMEVYEAKKSRSLVGFRRH